MLCPQGDRYILGVWICLPSVLLPAPPVLGLQDVSSITMVSSTEYAMSTRGHILWGSEYDSGLIHNSWSRQVASQTQSLDRAAEGSAEDLVVHPLGDDTGAMGA